VTVQIEWLTAYFTATILIIDGNFRNPLGPPMQMIALLFTVFGTHVMAIFG